ncbi:MAG: DUF3782 domain-containing protein [Desulfamplus sp.]|nr:DUF3782 domain-containing protein [Desulfamplus sp.]
MEQALPLDAVAFFKEVRDLYKETDRKFQETDRKLQDLAVKIEKVNSSIGDLGNRLGEFVEEMVRPAAVKLFQERGIDVHQVSRDVHVKRDGDEVEIDLLVVNDGELVVVECKSNLSIDDVNEHIERVSKVKKMFPHYRDMKVMGAVASMVMQENVGLYAYKKGFSVLCQSGDTMEIRNDDKFKARVW